MWLIIILLLLIMILSQKQTENFLDPVSCVIMLRRMKDDVKNGYLTNKQAEMLWISNRYDMACGSQKF